MTIPEIKIMLEESNFPVAYDHFAEGESPDPPLICFRAHGSHNFSADGKVYHKIESIDVELYTDLKSPEAEEIIEAVLDDHDIFWEKTETWIATEALYEVIYSFDTD